MALRSTSVTRLRQPRTFATRSRSGESACRRMCPVQSVPGAESVAAVSTDLQVNRFHVTTWRQASKPDRFAARPSDRADASAKFACDGAALNQFDEVVDRLRMT